MLLSEFDSIYHAHLMYSEGKCARPPKTLQMLGQILPACRGQWNLYWCFNTTLVHRPSW